MRIWLLIVLGLLLSTSLVNSESDWWDRFVESVSTKLHDAADFLKEKGGPAVREKFDSAKQKLQDPETHAEVQTWFKEKVFPVIEEKWNDAKQFFNEEVSPEVQKIYEAAVEGSEKVKEREEHNE
ncbi:hypothetical protein M3Y98_00967900 [Aphelenchoides besseyi]|nr:hypothetical protein M3Y98_00967900 [Aphelenchoides besseyi]KAI6194751.1 hypothetical protein M3Y96_01158000 [Aphelenchoides besseyi]